MVPLFDVGRGEALRWLCGCIVLWVHKPVVVSVGGFSEGVVVARDVIVEPSSIWFPWGHVVPAWAVVGVIRMVGATLEASAAVAVTRVL